MDIIDHGEWVAYRPESHWLLQHNPKILFCKRVSDGVDWYEYRATAGIPTSNTVKMTLMKIGDDWQVMTTERDGTIIWPESTKLIEFKYDGEHETLRQKFFDLDARQFRDPPKINTDRPLLRALAEELKLDVEQLTQTLRTRHG